MSPTRRGKAGDSKDALDGQLCMHSGTGAAMEVLHEQNDVKGQSSEEELKVLPVGFRFQGEALQRLQTMREAIAGDFRVEDDENVMQEFQFQRGRDSSISKASNVGLFRPALDFDDNDNEKFAESTGAVGETENDSVTAGPSCLSKHCKSSALSSLEAGTSQSRGCFAESTRLLVDEVDQRRSERRGGLNFGNRLTRGILSFHRQRGSGEESGNIIYQQVREEDEDKENEATENQAEQNANERQQSLLITEEDMGPENVEEIFLSVCVIVSAFRVLKLNNNDINEV